MMYSPQVALWLACLRNPNYIFRLEYFLVMSSLIAPGAMDAEGVPSNLHGRNLQRSP